METAPSSEASAKLRMPAAGRDHPCPLAPLALHADQQADAQCDGEWKWTLHVHVPALTRCRRRRRNCHCHPRGGRRGYRLCGRLRWRRPDRVLLTAVNMARARRTTVKPSRLLEHTHVPTHSRTRRRQPHVRPRPAGSHPPGPAHAWRAAPDPCDRRTLVRPGQTAMATMPASCWTCCARTARRSCSTPPTRRASMASPWTACFMKTWRKRCSSASSPKPKCGRPISS